MWLFLFFASYGILSCWIGLYCSVLCSIALNVIVLYVCIALYCTLLCVVWCCRVLNCVELYWFVMHRIVALLCPVCIVLMCVVVCCIGCLLRNCFFGLRVCCLLFVVVVFCVCLLCLFLCM